MAWLYGAMWVNAEHGETHLRDIMKFLRCLVRWWKALVVEAQVAFICIIRFLKRNGGLKWKKNQKNWGLHSEIRIMFTGETRKGASATEN